MRASRLTTSVEAPTCLLHLPPRLACFWWFTTNSKWSGGIPKDKWIMMHHFQNHRFTKQFDLFFVSVLFSWGVLLEGTFNSLVKWCKNELLNTCSSASNTPQFLGQPSEPKCPCCGNPSHCIIQLRVVIGENKGFSPWTSIHRSLAWFKIQPFFWNAYLPRRCKQPWRRERATHNQVLLRNHIVSASLRWYPGRKALQSRRQWPPTSMTASLGAEPVVGPILL